MSLLGSRYVLTGGLTKRHSVTNARQIGSGFCHCDSLFHKSVPILHAISLDHVYGIEQNHKALRSVGLWHYYSKV
jgi:hypothetical protein